MSQISVINSIEVPAGYEEIAISTRNRYIEYFSKQTGFVSSTFYRAINENNKFNFVNIVVWQSKEAFEAVVNQGFTNEEGVNADDMKVLGRGFEPPIQVWPGQYQVIAENLSA